MKTNREKLEEIKAYVAGSNTTFQGNGTEWSANCVESDWDQIVLANPENLNEEPPMNLE